MSADSSFSIIAGQPVTRRTLLRAAAVAGAIPIAMPESAFGAAAAPAVWVHGAADRIFPASPAESGQAIALDAAKGEHEAAQIMIRAGGSAISNVTLSASALTGPAGATIPASQIQIRRQYAHGDVGGVGGDTQAPPGGSASTYYDSLMDAAAATVAANTTQPYHLGVRVPAGQPAGRYSGTVTVASGSGNVAVPISVRVFDVALPAADKGKLKMNNWFTSAGWDYTGTIEAVPLQYDCQMFDDRWWTVMANFAKNHARHRNNVIYADFQALLIPDTTVDANGNFSFDWTTFDRFVNLFVSAGAMSYIYTPTLLEGAGPQVEILRRAGTTNRVEKVLVTPNGTEANAYLDKVFPALRSHLDSKGWTDVFYFSALDEPDTDAKATAAKWLYAKYAQYFPNPLTNEAHNHFMPALNQVLQTVTPTTEVYQNNIAAYQKFRHIAGKDLWFYTCIIPQGDYMNRFIPYHLNKTRLIPWLLWKVGAGGYLHWGWNYWVNGSVAAGWTAADTFNGGQSGDAWLVRPNVSALDVYDSVRSEAQLDGIEDYELLTLLAAAKPLTARAIANRLITDSTHYTHNGEDVVAAHRHVLEASVSPATDARFPVVDGFPDERNWTHVSGTWSVSGGAYSQTDSAAQWGYTSALKARAYGDFAATVDVQITAVNSAGGDTNWAGLMVRSCNASDMDTGYLVALRRNGEVFVYRCGDRLGGAQVPGFSAAAPTRLKVVARGSTLTICAGLAATPILTVTDSYYSAGNIALVTGGAAAKFSGFSVNPEIDYAEGKAVTVTSSYTADGWSPTAAVNGQTASVTGGLGWSSAGFTDANTTQSITVDFGQSYPVGRVDLYPRSDGANTGSGFPADYTIALSTDGLSWTTVATRTAVPRPAAGPQSSAFATKQARYLRVTATKLTADQFGAYHFQLAEIAAYGANLAAGRPVQTSSSYESAAEGWGAVAATDGSWLSALGTPMGWSSNSNLTANHIEWISVDLGAASSIKDVVLYARTDGDNTGACFPSDFVIETSTDNSAWTQVVSKTGYPAPDAQPQVFAFSPVTARYVRVRGTSLSPDNHGTYRMQLSELEVHAA
ncbi:discoidin domain-containing protein [Fodinicola acaciae]|uniref:discoidin domain-containing protein n=1 Tax=Fodinicola acaciae TaxID=2681555 RepID=UPI0013D43BE5|nr:glycoside hydrolase domain-containing protein [Fodinicola acaciae]